MPSASGTARLLDAPDRALRRVLGVEDRSEWLVNVQARLAYCPIPKCACSTVKRWFALGIEGQAPNLHRGGAIHNHCREHYSVSSKRPWSGAARLRGYTSFVILRDPVARAVSGFVSKFAKKPWLTRAAKQSIELNHWALHGPADFDTTTQVSTCSRPHDVPACSVIDYARGMTFREFVAFLARTPDAMLNEHFRSQAWFVGSSSFDVVGCQERLNQALDRVRRMVNLDIRLPDPRVRDELHGPFADADTPSADIVRGRYAVSADTLVTDDLRAVLMHRFDRDAHLHAEAFARWADVPAPRRKKPSQLAVTA